MLSARIRPIESPPPQTARVDDSFSSYSSYPSQFPTNWHPISPASPNSSRHSYPSSSSGRDGLSYAIEDGLSNLDEHEACLMRYFVVQLAHWFDICDGERHFATTVPLRARTCPPLLNAIYTASAQHLSRMKKRHIGNQVHYAGKTSSDENLLAAAVILRFYEEVDLPFMDEDTESALRGIQVFLDAQAISAVAGSGLRHAAYWIGLRQEVITAFSKQRCFRLPLGPCEPYRSFKPADNYVWADRSVIHCADVLQYCFGSEDKNSHRESNNLRPNAILHTLPDSPSTKRNSISRYEELVAFETFWAELGPRSFKPIYAHEPDRSRGEVFPELWYLNDCHVAGLQHLELARILLTVHDPKLPRLGLGLRTAMHSVDHKIRSIVLRICGIALSNQHSPPGLVTTSAAIGMCGDRFTDRGGTGGVVGVLGQAGG